MKKCFKCGEIKPLSSFYKHKQMADGHLNKCKCCTKKDTIANREDKIDYYRAYDRERGNRQDPEYVKEYRERYPKKYKAHNTLNNALRDGKITRQDCEVCGSPDSVAHHDDYDHPLKVRWLCQVHHKEWHSEHGEGANGT